LGMVVCSPGARLFGGTAPGDALPAPESTGVVDPGVTKLGLLGSPGEPSPPVTWRQAEGSTEQVCSWVVTTDMLLWEVMTMVGRDILLPIRISLKKR
jgi:hypothetical protein